MCTGWNRADFDMDKSWQDSFKYIDEDASEELYTFAKHMSDPSPKTGVAGISFRRI